MSIRHIVIATIAAAGFSFAASAAPMEQPAPKLTSAVTLAGHHHHMHHGHWRHHHRHHHGDGPFCLFSLAPWCWR
ncbi:MAG: hypothetical protein WBX25_19440 [Rhodomicrobium sp.]